MVVKQKLLARIEVQNHYYFNHAAASPAVADVPPPPLIHVSPPYATRSLTIRLTANIIHELAAQLELASGAGQPAALGGIADCWGDREAKLHGRNCRGVPGQERQGCSEIERLYDV